MSLDFWAVKIKKGMTENNFRFDNCWDLVEDEEIHPYIDKSISEFIRDNEHRDLYNFCMDTIGFFVKGDPIYINSKDDINLLTDKLNRFIKENPNYEYKKDNILVYPNKDIKKFITYINEVRDKCFVLWCSW